MNLLKRLMGLSLLLVSMVALGGPNTSVGDRVLNQSVRDSMGPGHDNLHDNLLAYAACYPSTKNIEIAKQAIADGANVNAVVDYLPVSFRHPDGTRTNIHNWTPLMFAADAIGIGRTSAERDSAMVIAKILIAHGARVNQADTEGRTPLTIAVKKSDNEMAKLLLEHGALIDGNSMREAARQNNPEIIKTLETHMGTWQKVKWKTYGVLWK